MGKVSESILNICMYTIDKVCYSLSICFKKFFYKHICSSTTYVADVLIYLLVLINL